MSFLALEKKKYLVLGVANKRSVAFHVGRRLEEEGAYVIYSVRSESRRESVCDLLEGREVHVCDIEHDAEIHRLAAAIAERHGTIDGFVHSIAFANYDGFSGAFHEVSRKDFLQAVSISAYSLMALADAFKNRLTPNAAVVTISISTTRMAAEAYGYMAPAKAALNSAVVFLAKSFSRFSQIRFNALCAGLLKTSASAGIPDYVDYYLFAEQATLRKRALTTEEVANTALFLLSEQSSGINAQEVVVDAGMGVNYFDGTIVKPTVRSTWPTKD